MNQVVEVYDRHFHLLREEGVDEYFAGCENEWLRERNIATKLESVRVLVLNSQGGIHVRQRGRESLYAPRCGDVTASGYLMAGELRDHAAMRVCMTDLEIPAMVSQSKTEFTQDVDRQNLRELAVFELVSMVENFQMYRIVGAETPMKFFEVVNFYVGFYDGPVTFKDAEDCRGLFLRRLEELSRDRSMSYSHEMAFLQAVYPHRLVAVDQLRL